MSGDSGHHRDAKLGRGQRRFLLMLALPAFGIALAYTVVTTYTPVLLSRLGGPAATGMLIAMEGLLALLVPVVIGGWSDRLRTRWGSRLPFVVVGAVVAVAALVLLPLVAGSRYAVAVALAVFFVAYFVYYAPYYALFPDLVPEDERGRSQGFQGALRSAGLLVGMAGGGVLLGWWLPLPFLVAAVAVAAVTIMLAAGLRRRLRSAPGTATISRPHTGGELDRGGRTSGFRASWALVRDDRSLRWWLFSNSCWEASIAALRTFVVLYFTRGLGLSLGGSSGALALVGVAAVLAAPVAGKLSDRYGPQRVMRVAAWVFALGLTPPLFTTNHYFLAAIVPIAFAAVVLMTLPYALLMDLLPSDSEHGLGASLFEFSRGVGVIVGPLLAGTAVQLTGTLTVLTFRRTSGFAAIFAIAMILVLASTPMLSRVSNARRR